MKNESSIAIDCIDVREIINKYERIDFLKIDIEGAENEVIFRIDEDLQKIERIFLEYHSIKGQKQDVGRIMDILNRNGFRIYMHPGIVGERPFVEIKTNGIYDFQINIFAMKNRDRFLKIL